MSSNSSSSSSKGEESDEEISKKAEKVDPGEQIDPGGQWELQLPPPANGESYTIEEILQTADLKRALKLRVLHNGWRVPPADDILIPRLLNPSYCLIPSSWLAYVS